MSHLIFYAFLIVIPGFYAVKRLGLWRWWTASLLGFVLATIYAAYTALPPHGANQGVWMLKGENSVLLVDHGIITGAGWMDYVHVILLVGLVGAAVGFFWRLLSRLASVSTRHIPARARHAVGNFCLLVYAVLAGLVLVGFALAFLSRPSIEREMRQQALSSGAVGMDMIGRRIDPAQFRVGSRVDMPFLVDGYYAVPFDMHAVIHATTYLVMPWGRYAVKHEVVHTV